jgi:hypothetical protein
MSSPERNFSGAPGPRRLSAVDERLVSLEDEATRLRAEVAALQDEIRWLTGQDEDPPSWLTRGWVRASLLLTAVGLAALVSLPYLLHVEAPVAAARPAPAAPRAPMAPAPAKAAARDAVPAPTRVPEVPPPARVLDAGIQSADHAGAAPRPRPPGERRAIEPSDAVVVAPTRGESP